MTFPKSPLEFFHVPSKNPEYVAIREFLGTSGINSGVKGNNQLMALPNLVFDVVQK